jgi:hypothetical protein
MDSTPASSTGSVVLDANVLILSSKKSPVIELNPGLRQCLQARRVKRSRPSDETTQANSSD